MVFAFRLSLVFVVTVTLAAPFPLNSRCQIYRSSQQEQPQRSIISCLNSNIVRNSVPEGQDTEISSKRKIEIMSQVQLPFDAEIAYDAFADLPRQPSWSPWLSSVEYLNEGDVTVSLWTLKVLGFRYHWTAVATVQQRPHRIEWESTSGLKNFGCVQFEPSHDDAAKTIMTMRMSFIAPRAVSALFRRSKALGHFVENKMIASSLDQFRTVVLETDVQQKADPLQQAEGESLQP